jgi:hypothetical protein
MSGVISFSESPEQAWVMAGWVFRQVLEDVLANQPDDHAMKRVFEMAEAIGGLHVNTLEPELRDRITESMRRVVSDILAGRIQSGIKNKTYGDARTVAQYRESVKELMKSMPAKR